MFEKEAIIHAFEATIGIECLNKPIEDFTYEELSDEQQEKAYDFKKGAEFGYNKANERLAKAKKLLTRWVELFKPKGGNIPPTPVQVETEQFISEAEK